MAAIILRNPKTSTTRTLLRMLSSSTPQEKPLISIQTEAKTSIRKETNPEKIAEIFLKTTKHNRAFRDRGLFETTVAKLTQLKRFDLIEQILENQKESDSVKSEGFWIRIIMLYSNARMVDQAKRTFDQMEQLGCTRTEKSFCALLSACLMNRKFDLVQEYFKSIPEETGISPGIVGYNLVIRALCGEKSFDGAYSLIQEMEKSGLKPDTSSYNTLLTAYLENGEMTKFDELYKEFTTKGLEPNLVTYNLRLTRLCKDKECVRAKKMLDEMVSKGVKPNINSYNIVIRGFCKIADFESAQKVFDSVRPADSDKESFPSNDKLYITLVSYLVKEGEFETALKICKESLERKCVPPFSTMEDLVNGLTKLSKVNEAKEIIEDMKTKLRGTATDAWSKVEGRLQLQ